MKKLTVPTIATEVSRKQGGKRRTDIAEISEITALVLDELAERWSKIDGEFDVMKLIRDRADKLP